MTLLRKLTKILSLIGESLINLYTLRVHHIRQKNISNQVLQSRKSFYQGILEIIRQTSYFVRKDNFTIELHGLEIDEHWKTR